jgi:alkylation response protein AidB-like acyl-CoA dehydrogenase
MDLDLTDEQTWLAESIESLLSRGGDDTWGRLVEFGGLSVGDDGLGAVEMCIIAHGLGRHLASTPYVSSAATGYALGGSTDAVSVALLEPGRGWHTDGLQTTFGLGGLLGEKVAVEHATTVDELAVVAASGEGPALVLVPREADGVSAEPQDSLDAGVPLARVNLAGVDAPADRVTIGDDARATLGRLMAVGGLLAAAEAVGAAQRVLDDAREYASQRKQFGRTIGSNQALRHILADMVVRQLSSWSSVLYAAAGLDDGAPDAQRSASVAKAWATRATQEVAHGAMQVFGGIAFTDEHSAHRYLRRIIVRGQQFGDADHHERALGRALATQGAQVSGVA